MNRFVGPELLRPDHVIDEFDCGDEALNRWFTSKARHNQAEGASRTWVVTDGRQVVGYHASSTAVVMRSAAPTRGGAKPARPLPAILLGRLAIDVKYRSLRLGAALLKHFIVKSLEVAQIVGVRVLLVHAKNDEVAGFYRRYGFEPSPIDDLTLLMLVKDATA